MEQLIESLPTFTYDRLPKWSFFAVISGQRGSGKTVLAHDFLFNTKGRFTHVFLCSGSIKVQPKESYFPMIGDGCRFGSEHIDEVLEKLFEIQTKDLIANGRDLSKVARPLVLIDDAIGNTTSTWSSKLMLKMATQGRHVGISLLYLSACTPNSSRSACSRVSEFDTCFAIWRIVGACVRVWSGGLFEMDIM